MLCKSWMPVSIQLSKFTKTHAGQSRDTEFGCGHPIGNRSAHRGAKKNNASWINIVLLRELLIGRLKLSHNSTYHWLTIPNCFLASTFSEAWAHAPNPVKSMHKPAKPICGTTAPRVAFRAGRSSIRSPALIPNQSALV